MKNVAFVCSIPLFPPSAGNRIRALNLARAIKSMGCNVTFFFITSETLSPHDLECHKNEFGEENFIHISRSKWATYAYFMRRIGWEMLRRLRRLMRAEGGYYHAIDELYSPYYTAELRKFCKKIDFDTVFVTYAFNSAAFKAFDRSTLKVLDTHDAFADRHKKFLHTKNPTTSYWYSVPPEQEIRAFRRSDIVISIQEAEAVDFKARIGNDKPEVLTISHFITMPDRLADYERTDAVFVGSGGETNSYSVSWFIEHVIPIIVAEIPHFRLHVFGSVCKAIRDYPGIVKHDYIENLADAYQYGSITINPTLMGTGINIKLLDAMACGSPTVATDFGVRGLPERFRQGVLVTENGASEEFARQVIALATDRSYREKMGAQARDAAQRWNEEQMSILASLDDKSGAR